MRREWQDVRCPRHKHKRLQPAHVVWLVPPYAFAFGLDYTQYQAWAFIHWEPGRNRCGYIERRLVKVS